jgi:hypothetical protein
MIMFIVPTMVLAAFARWFGAWKSGLLFLAIVALCSGFAPPIAAAVFVMIAFLSIGMLIVRAPTASATDCILVGLSTVGTVFGASAALPIHFAGVWAIALAVPIALARRRLETPIRDFLSRLSSAEDRVRDTLVTCGLFSAASIHLLVGMMPEVGYDALAMHLFVPSQIHHSKHWGFDAESYVWAVMPMLTDWSYSIAFLFGGEGAARILNVFNVYVLATLIWRISRWGGASDFGSKFAALLFLLTPLTFLESSSLFIDSAWAALVLGGTFAFLRLVSGTEPIRSSTIASGVMWGGALAAKAVSLVILPSLIVPAIAGRALLFRRPNASWISIGALLALVVGCVPYVCAWKVTGNPVFPFFNSFFQSPLYPAVDFNADAFFARGVSWRTPFEITFNSTRHIEGTLGSSGFQWLLVFLPGAVAVVLSLQRRGMALAWLSVAWFVLTFLQNGYLRYVFPSVALGCTVIAVAWPSEWNRSRVSSWLGVFAAACALCLNLLHFSSATYYGTIDLQVISDPDARARYLHDRSPIRCAVDLVNLMNLKRSPVAFISAPYGAGISANAIYANWYNGPFLAELKSVSSPESLLKVLAGRNVEFLVSDPGWLDGRLEAHLDAACDTVAKFGQISVRRVRRSS